MKTLIYTQGANIDLNAERKAIIKIKLEVTIDKGTPQTERCQGRNTREMGRKERQMN